MTSIMAYRIGSLDVYKSLYTMCNADDAVQLNVILRAGDKQ